MQLVERHMIKKGDSRFTEIDHAAFAAKNLYNAANYQIRQTFIRQGLYLNYVEMNAQMKTTEQYQALPRKVSQQVLRLLDKNWQSFFALLRLWKEDPEKLQGRPSIPSYLDKQTGRYVLIYTIQAVSRIGLRRGVIQPSGLNIEIQTKQTRIVQLRIVPKHGHYLAEVVYERDIEPAAVDPNLVAAIDIGLNNLAAITSDKAGFVPVLINGRPLKRLNQWYNKQIAHLQQKLGRNGRTNLMHRITHRRNLQIDHYLHTHSRRVIRLLVSHGIGTLVIGKNPEWKQGIRLGRRNNQNFVQVPHARFIQMMIYKAELVGIQVILVEESHTSKCSFLDNEPVGHHDRYLGRRTHRGLFLTSDGRRINADVNGSYNILRKAIPNAFGNGTGGVVVHPVGKAPTN